MVEALKEKYSLEDTALISQTQIGPSIGRELTKNALIAVLVACIAMLVYIAIRFEFAFGVAAIIALVHDVLITLSVYAIFDIPVNSSFIAAMLTIVGYSINDISKILRINNSAIYSRIARLKKKLKKLEICDEK